MPRGTPSWLASAADLWVRMERALGLGRRSPPVVAPGKLRASGIRVDLHTWNG